jgi:hypothetical protein
LESIVLEKAPFPASHVRLGKSPVGNRVLRIATIMAVTALWGTGFVVHGASGWRRRGAPEINDHLEGAT